MHPLPKSWIWAGSWWEKYAFREHTNPVNEKALKPEPELTIEAKAKVLMEAEPKIIINPVTEPKIESESIPVLEHSNNSTNPPTENNEPKNPV